MTTRHRSEIDDIVDRLDRDDGVVASVGSARLHIDRPLPFICVARPRAEDADDMYGLIAGQGSYLIATGSDDGGQDVRAILEPVLRELTDRFQSVLVLEIWVATEPPGEQPTFRVHAPKDDRDSATVLCLRQALHDITQLSADIVDTSVPAPEDIEPVLTADAIRKAGCVFLGLEVPRIYVDGSTGRRLPLVYRRLQHALMPALQRSFFEFATVQTSFAVKDYRALGKRSIDDAAREVDRQLVKISEDMEFLLAVTPVNTDEAWTEFQSAGCSREPALHYRPLRVDPDELKRRLFDARIEDIDDPTLAALFRAKRHELDRLATMLEDRESPNFIAGSMQIYGRVSDELHASARKVLERLCGVEEQGIGPVLDAEEIAYRARRELDHYRTSYPELSAKVEVRDDVLGVLVTEGDLLIGSRTQVQTGRLDALLQHEIGTHVVTYANGAAQPIRQLQIGLPGYEETQEGLGTLAEYVAGGLTGHRLATIAARVMAVRALLDGSTFVDTYRLLTGQWAFVPHVAFTITTRVFRSGGLTKDAIYLRGLEALLHHLREDGPLEPLLVGKLPLRDVPVVEELLWRGVLREPVLRPRWLDHPEAAGRLAVIRKGKTVRDIADEVAA